MPWPPTPTYDPSLWVRGMSAGKYAELNAEAAHNPFLNRAMNGLYPAGSTFKPFVAATALNAGIITPDTIFNCTGKFSVKGQTWKCWQTDGHGDVNLLQAIEQSCDVYFYNLGNLLYQQPTAVLQNGVGQFGFGKTTGIDLPYETSNGPRPRQGLEGRARQDRGRQDLEARRRHQPRDRPRRPVGHPPSDGGGPVRPGERRHALGPSSRLSHHGRFGQRHPHGSNPRSAASWA